MSRRRPTKSRPPPMPARCDRIHALDVPFELRAVASGSGARWDTEHGVFIYRGEALPQRLHPFRSRPYSLQRRVEERLNGRRNAAETVPSVPTMVARPHQRQAVAAIAAAVAARYQGFLLADDVGLGKTVSAWQSVLEMAEAHTILIVCPLAVVAHWRHTLMALGDGGRDIVVLNYERVGKLFELSAAQRKRVKSKKGLARYGTAPTFDVVIWDESHRCKNPTAARSKLAAKINAKAGFILWLSATAGQNPLELSYLAPVLARVTGDKPGDLKDFEMWCASQGLGVERGAYGRWQWSGAAADCERVRSLLFDGEVPAGIRRRPEEIAGWPAINRILTPIALEPAARDLYAQAWTAFRREMDLEARGGDPRSTLAKMVRFRQKGSLLRIAGTINLIMELLENGHQVAVSVAFIETLDALHDAFIDRLGESSCALIHGQLSAADKEDERLRFQRGQARIVLFTVEEGISLHQGELLGSGEIGSEAVRSEVIHDLRWSAIQMAQIEGRCHRDGRFAQVYWTYADETIEERIARIVSGRIESMKAMVGDDVQTIKEIERLLSDG